MGFNKRYINKDKLYLYKKKNIDSLISYITTSDCLIFEDKYSELICSFVLQLKKTHLKKKLIEIGFYESE